LTAPAGRVSVIWTAGGLDARLETSTEGAGMAEEEAHRVLRLWRRYLTWVARIDGPPPPGTLRATRRDIDGMHRAIAAYLDRAG
jgi:hypothetical protein